MHDWKPCPERSTDHYEVEERENHDLQIASLRYRYRVRIPAWQSKERPWWAGLPTLPSPQTSSTSSELNLNWAHDCPELFADSVRRFQEEHPESEWEWTVTMRPCYMVMTAKRRS